MSNYTEYRIDNILTHGLPRALRDRAICCGNELAWPEDSALDVTRFLASKACAIVGVEAFTIDGGDPKWLATSNYVAALNPENDDYIEKCLDGAIQFIHAFGSTPNVAFNF
ncbi:MAG TPA: hypothetical protein VGK19_22415 [Capsulimonadaceae bacterium]